jgi:hypothetical protein
MNESTPSAPAFHLRASEYIVVAIRRESCRVFHPLCNIIIVI